MPIITVTVSGITAIHQSMIGGHAAANGVPPVHNALEGSIMASRNPIIAPGQKFNRLTAVAFSYRSKNNGTYWVFACVCGNTHVASASSVKTGKIKSCGCLKREVNMTHGLRCHPLYGTFHQMHARCYNSDSKSFANYGGRGIFVAPEWHDLVRFISDMGERPEGMSLDRIDNDGPYSLENCRWATMSTQHNNRRDNRIVEYKGKQMVLSQATKLAGLSYNTVLKRLHNGWPAERSLTEPIGGY